MDSYLFTSESVSEGHPDKVADQISDAILDAILAQDPYSRVAAETLCNTGLVVLAGEITTQANVDYIDIARETLKRIGYDNSEYGIDHKGCSVLVGYDKQSNDIAQGVDRASDDYLEQGAGDQGLMFGYACDETPTLMPAAIYYAHRLVQQQSIVRRNGTLDFLRPDAKSQVTLRYENGKPVAIDTVVLSTQHHPRMSDGNKMKPEFIEAEKGVTDKIKRVMGIQGKRSVDSIHRELGLVMWDFVGMARNKAGLEEALEKIKAIRKEFWTNVYVPGTDMELNVELEKALRLSDFIEIAELMARDALLREESCGGHFREEHQTEDGEALRDDEHFAYVSCWKYTGEGSEPELLKEPLNYEFVQRQQRNYKA